MSIKTIFLDRDGVINKEVSYLHNIDQFEFISGVFDACQYLQMIGFKIIIITNQSGISRGFYTEKDFLNLNDWMIKEFLKKNINILNVFYCPHLPSDKCNCRKPKPGMFLEAKKKYIINMSESWAIGDSERDIIAATSAGVKNTILVRSGHKIDEENSKAKFYLDSIKDISDLIKN